MEVRDEAVDHAEPVARARSRGRSRRRPAARCRRASAAVSRVRVAVVPTATTRPPRRAWPRHRLGGLVAGSRRAPGRRGGPRRRSTLTGRKVPGPTCRTTSACPIPRWSRRLEQGRREVQAGGGRGDAPRLARVDGLVALAVSRRVGPPDVGRQGHVAVALEGGGDVTIAARRSRTGAGGPGGRPWPACGLDANAREPSSTLDHGRRRAGGGRGGRARPRAARRRGGAHEEDLGGAAARLAGRGGGPGRRGCGSRPGGRPGRGGRAGRGTTGGGRRRVARSRTRRRDASRSARGSCAMASGGRS